MRSNLIVILRNFILEKYFSLAKVVALAIGFTCTILAFNYVSYELGYDDFWDDSDRIYRIGMEVNMAGSEFLWSNTPGALPGALAKDYPEVEYVSRIFSRGSTTSVDRDGEILVEGRLLYAGDEAFKILDFSFQEGNPEDIIGKPNAVLITESIAEKYFKENNPINEVINLNGIDYFIKGVVSDSRKNTHSSLKYSFITSDYNFRVLPTNMDNWTDFFGPTFIKLKPKVNEEEFEKKIRNISHKYNKEYMDSHNWEFFSFLEPINKLHTSSVIDAGNSLETLYTILGVSILILVIACINFVFLSTAKVTRSFKQNTIRMILGSSTRQLFIANALESGILVVFGFFSSMILTLAISPFYTYLTDRNFTLSEIVRFENIAFIILVLFVVFCICSFLPALYSNRAFSGKNINLSSKSNSGIVFRKVFITLQLSVTTLLVLVSIIVYKQMSYLSNKDMGIEISDKVILRVNTMTDYEMVKNEFLNNPSITGASASTTIIGANSFITTRLYGQEFIENNVVHYPVDPDYITEYEIEVIAGRSFNPSTGADINNTIIINETASKAFGWNNPQNAIGKILESGGRGEEYKKEVIGVVKDFNFRPLHYDIDPLALVYNPERFRILNLSLKKTNIKESINYIENKCKELNLARITNYFFLEDRIRSYYDNERKISKIFSVSTILALLISYLGLISLISYINERRIKEIAIRKVQGASFTEVFLHLSREFIILTIIGFIVSIPVAYYFMSIWLQKFAYRIDIGVGLIVLSGVITSIIALIALYLQSIKVARTNPSTSLKYE